MCQAHSYTKYDIFCARSIRGRQVMAGGGLAFRIPDQLLALKVGQTSEEGR